MPRAADRYRLRGSGAGSYYSLRIRATTARLLCRAGFSHGVALTESWDARLFQLGEIALNLDAPWARPGRRRGRD